MPPDDRQPVTDQSIESELLTERQNQPMFEDIQASEKKCGSQVPSAFCAHRARIPAACCFQELHQRNSRVDGDSESVDDLSDIYAAVYDR